MIYTGLLAAVCCCIGMMLADAGVLTGAAGTGLLGAAVLLGWLRRKQRMVLIAAVLCAACAAGALRMEQAAWQYASLPHYMANGNVLVQGRIVTQKRSFSAASGTRMGRYVLEGDRIAFADDGTWRPMQGKLYVTVPENDALQPYTPVQFAGTVKAISYYRNEGMYDAQHRDKEQSVFLRAYSDAPDSMVATGTPTGWRHVMQGIRGRLTKWFQTVLSESQSYILSSLLFGGHYEDLPPTLLESFSTTGLIHILSVSGSHMALLLSVVQIAGKALGLRQRMLFFISAVFVVSYGALAEFTAPVVRSAVMGLIAAYSITARREYTSGHALGLAILAMVWYSPYLVYDLSFRLSCGASAGIILLQPKIMPYIRFLPVFLRHALGVCLSAQALVLPVICSHFFALPVYTVLANILVAPALDMAIVLGMMASVTSLMVPFLSQGILYVVSLCLDLGVQGNYFLASLPHSRLWVGAMPVYGVAAWYMGIACLFMSGRRRKYCGGMACMLLFCGYAWSAWRTPEAQVMIFDVGNDQATCAIFPDKSAYVWYNKSEWSNPEQAAVVLTPALRYAGIFRLTGCTVSGYEAAATGEQLASLFAIDTPVQYDADMKHPVAAVRTPVPYYIYPESTDSRWPQGGCAEIRRLSGYKETQFPDRADVLIVHGRPGSEIYTEWLEQADFLDIPVFSPARDGQITGVYRDQKWSFAAYGGDSI